MRVPATMDAPTSWRVVEDEQRMLSFGEATPLANRSSELNPGIVVFELFLDLDDSTATRLAEATRRALRSRLDDDRWTLAVVDGPRDSDRTAAARVCDFPTLIRSAPTPRSRAIGITPANVSRHIGLLLGLEAGFLPA